MGRRASVSLLGLIVFLATSAVWAAGSSSVAGTIYGDGRVPLEEVEVGLISLSTGKTVLTDTDIAGQYGFADLASGEYSLYFELADYENGGAKLDHRAANRSCFWAE